MDNIIKLQDKNNLKFLNGKFINLRLIKISDAELTFKWRNSTRAKYLNQGSKTVKEQQNWIASRPSNEFNYIIETKNEKPVGMISLIDIDLINLKAEPGRFLIGNTEKARGIPAAFEAMKLIYELAFDLLKLHRIYGTISEENTEMIKLQKYFGMKEEGRLRKHYYINGRFQDAIYFGLLINEYRDVTLTRLNNIIGLLKTDI